MNALFDPGGKPKYPENLAARTTDLLKKFGKALTLCSGTGFFMPQWKQCQPDACFCPDLVFFLSELSTAVPSGKPGTTPAVTGETGRSHIVPEAGNDDLSFQRVFPAQWSATRSGFITDHFKNVTSFLFYRVSESVVFHSPGHTTETKYSLLQFQYKALPEKDMVRFGTTIYLFLRNTKTNHAAHIENMRRAIWFQFIEKEVWKKCGSKYIYLQLFL